MNHKMLAGAFAVLCSAALLAGCGGGGGGAGNVRLVNATHDYAALDFFTSTTEQAAGVAEGSVSPYVGLNEGSYSFQLRQAGAATASLSTTLSVGKDTSYSLVAYNTGSTLSLAYFTDNQGAPTSGTAALRLFDGAAAAGGLDVYVTAPDADLASSTPMASDLSSASVGSYAELTKGTYRVRVTAAGSKTDVRLDIPSLTLADQEIATLIITSSRGGSLVNGVLLDQGGSATPYRNANARVRVVAAVTANGRVDAATSAATLSSALQSPSVGGYVVTPATLAGLAVSVEGHAMDMSALTVAPGEDASLLLYGDVGAPQWAVLHDDNVPDMGTGNAKVRLVHLVNGLGSTLSLAVNYLSVADNIAFGSASSPATVAAASGMRLEATSPVSGSPLFLATDVSLSAQGVYTMFMLGNAAAPVGRLVKDR